MTRSGRTSSAPAGSCPTRPMSRMAYAWTLFRRAAPTPRWRRRGARSPLDPLAPGLRHSLVALAIGARRYDLALREVRPGAEDGVSDPVSAVLEAYAQLLSGAGGACAGRDPARGSRCAPCACTSSAGPARRPRWPIRSRPSSTPSTTTSCTSTPTSRPTTPGGATPPGRCTGWSAPSAHSPMLHQWQLRSGLFDRVRNATRVPGRTLARPRAGRGPAAGAARRDRGVSAVPLAFRVPLRRRVRRAVGRTGDRTAAPRAGGAGARPSAVPRRLRGHPATTRSPPRGIACRIRFGADGRRSITLGMSETGLPAPGPSDLVESEAGAIGSGRHPRRGQRARAQASERWWIPPGSSPASSWKSTAWCAPPSRPWRLPGRFAFLYDRVTVRNGRLTREFQELKVRRLAAGRPRLEELARALEQSARTSPGAADQAGARTRAAAEMGRESLIRNLDSGRAVAVIALEDGRVAVLRDGEAHGFRWCRARASRPCATGWPSGSAPAWPTSCSSGVRHRRSSSRASRSGSPGGSAAGWSRAEERAVEWVRVDELARAVRDLRPAAIPRRWPPSAVAARSALVPEWTAATGAGPGSPAS